MRYGDDGGRPRRPKLLPNAVPLSFVCVWVRGQCGDIGSGGDISSGGG